MLAKQQELSELGELYAAQQRRLAEAQQAQAEIVRKERELQDAQRELELVIEQRVSANVATIQQKARQDAEQLLERHEEQQGYFVPAGAADEPQLADTGTALDRIRPVG